MGLAMVEQLRRDLLFSLVDEAGENNPFAGLWYTLGRPRASP